MNLTGKTILLTGASQGIGAHLATELAAAGAKLLLVARSTDKLQQFIQTHGEQHKAYACDLNDRQSVRNLVSQITGEQQTLDVIVHCAGIGVYKPLAEITEADWDQSFAIGLTAPFLITQGLMPLLEKTPDSLLLVIGSGSGVIPMKNRTTYCSLKFGLRGWTLSLVEEFAGRNPNICLITLGSTLTGFGPMTVEEKKQHQAEGKAYFPVEWVATKLRKVIEDDQREKEVTLFPSEFGFGEWNKP